MDMAANPMVMEKEINCGNFRGLLNYLQKHYGDQGIQKVLAGLVGNDRFLIADKKNTTQARPVDENDLRDSSNWVSNEFSLSLLANVKKVVAGPNPLFTAGEGTTRESFSANVLFLSRVLGPKLVAKRVAKINTLFNRTKTVELAGLTDHSATFKLSYVSGVRVTKDVCQWNMGIYSGIAKLGGVINVQVEEKTCLVEGDSCCTIRVTWKNVGFWKRLLQWLMRAGLKDLIEDYERALTERNQVIDELTQSERRYKVLTDDTLKEKEKFQLLVEGTPFGVALVNQKGHYRYINPKFEEIFGYTLEDISTGRDWFQKAYPDEAYRKQVISAWKEDQNMVGPREFRPRIYKVHCKDEAEKWIHIRSVAFRDGTQLITYEDITERLRAEEALRKAQHFNQRVMEITPNLIYIYDLQEQRNVYSNPRMIQVLGYTPEEIEEQRNRVFPNILHPDDLTRVVEHHTRLASSRTGEVLGLEYRMKHRDGRWLWLRSLDTVFARDDQGRVRQIIGTAQDVTAQKQATQDLLESEEKYRSLFNNAEVGMFRTKLDGSGFLDFNEKYLEIFGYTREEMLGSSPIVHWADRGERREMVRRLEAEGRVTDFECGMLNKQGEVRRCLTSVKVYGDQAILEGSILDITERKRAEEEKEKLEGQLQQAQKLEALGTLAGGVAHDFNNILMGIQGRASLMLSDIEDSHPFIEHLKGIETYVKSAADLTKQLLGFARRGKYEVQPTDLNRLVGQSAGLFGRTKKEIILHRKFQPDLWTVEVDRRQLDQVMLNLFVNAWQAMPSGGDIYLETRNVLLEENYVRSHGVRAGRYVKVSVTDTGTGMDETTKQRIFDPFFTTKEMGRGTGLGLASAYGIIRNHLGIITVYSQKGHGTTFNIYLPASGKEVPMEGETSADIKRGSGTVLLVDDEEMILDVGRRLLEKLGYRVITASGGEEALKIVSESGSEIRLVILDMIMPGMSGEETFKRIKAGYPGINVLLASGYSLNGQAQDILNMGCNGFIQKPFDLADFSQRIGGILEKP
jgi:two-component system cell cycle sensor histidine kinase/response regulator CckA